MSLVAPTVRAVTRLRTAGVFRDARPLDERRARLEAASRTMPRPRDVQISEDMLAGRPVLRARPRPVASDAAVLYLHGGSYVAGDSAGGGIALAATTRLARDPATTPAALLLLSPWLDLTMSGHSVRSRIETEVMLDPATIAADAHVYAGGHDLADPGVSPLFSDLTHLPPTLVQVGDRDILLADSERLAERGGDNGHGVELQVWSDMWHVWHTAAPLLPEANTAIRDAGAWLRLHL